MASKYWLKLYHEMLDDPKVCMLRPAVRWRFVEALLVAGECDEDGFIPDPARYAWRVRDNVDKVETDFVELAEAGLLSQVDGRWIVTKFAERQAPVSGAERVARYRKRQQKQEYYALETATERTSNDDVTNRYTDIDIDKKRIYKNGRGTHKHELDPEARPDFDHIEKRREMVSALSGVVKTTFALGVNDSQFEQVAEALMAEGFGVEQVKQFGDWWRSNGHYEGKPALMSVLQEIKNAAGESYDPYADLPAFSQPGE